MTISLPKVDKLVDKMIGVIFQRHSFLFSNSHLFVEGTNAR
jgi:hypothetical protein